MAKGRKTIYLDYLTSIIPIKEYLKDSPLSEKSVKSKIQALNKFFPYLLNRFKEELAIEFDLDEYESIVGVKKNPITQEWEKNDVHNNLFNLWTKLDSNKKSDLFNKWVVEYGEKNESTKKGSYVNYVWQIQGLFSKMGALYGGNPKNMIKDMETTLNLTQDITFEEICELYDIIPNKKYKLIVKIMMYNGLNPIDIVDLKPEDFKRYDNTKYYYLFKKRIKTTGKDVYYLNAFEPEFVNELKEYFERKIVRRIQKTPENTEKINELTENKHFRIIYEGENYVDFEGRYDWNKDKKLNLFGNISSPTVSERIKYHVETNGLNRDLNPQHIRRLCFTRLQKVFSLEDKDIFDLWSQHKIGMVSRHYITNKIEKMIDYFKDNKIQPAVVIGNTKKLVKEIEQLREDNEEIKVLREKHQETENELKRMSTLMVLFKKEIEELKEQIDKEES